MCPTLLRLETAAGRAGRMWRPENLPLVFQLISYMIDAGMSVHDAAHAPRIDISGSEMVTIMSTMPEDIINELTERTREPEFAPMTCHPLSLLSSAFKA